MASKSNITYAHGFIHCRLCRVDTTEGYEQPAPGTNYRFRASALLAYSQVVENSIEAVVEVRGEVPLVLDLYGSVEELDDAVRRATVRGVKEEA